MNIKKFFEKTILLFSVVSMLVQPMSAVTSPLLNPQRNGQSGIIDVGYNNGTAPTAASIPKDLLTIPALLREIEASILVKERDHEVHDCRFDVYGSKACPVNQMTCNGSIVYDNGTAVTTTKTITIYAPKIPAGNVTAFNNWYYERDRTANSKFESSALTAPKSWSRCQDGVYTDHYGQTFVNPPYKKSMPKWDSWYNGNYGGTSLRGGNWESLSTDTKKLNGSNGIPVESNGHCCAKLRRICSITQYIPEHCPDGYQDNGTNCKKDLTYSYSEYFCPENPGAGQPWTIVDIGGDCNGLGLDASNQCNSPTPPVNNCVRPVYTCPVGDERNECSMQSTSGVEPVENLFNGYIYRSGTVEHFSATRTQVKVCPGQDNICDGLSDDVHFTEDTANPGVCISSMIKQASTTGICPDGFVYNSSKQICYLQINGATPNFNTMNYEITPISKYNPDLNRCESDMVYECTEPGYVYDEDIGECVGEYNCNGYWNEDTGKCEIAPTIECPEGYTYNLAVMRCESAPYCEVGTLNMNPETFQCEENNYFCPAGWEFDTSGNKCTKDMETINPICAESTQTWNDTLAICEGTISSWSIEDPWNTGAWTVSGSTATQSLNSTMPTFYLSNKKFQGVEIEGKVYIDSTSNENDSVGLVFGYIDSSEYYVINWQKNSTGSSGGSYLLSIQKIKNQSPNGGHGFSGTGGTTLAGVNFGWSYDTWQTIKVTTGLNQINVYINGVLKATANVDTSKVYGRVGYFNQSQAKATYKDFKIKSLPTCISGYIYSTDHDICVKEYPFYEYQFDILKYVQGVHCPAGNYEHDYEHDIRACITRPDCEGSGIFDAQRQTCFVESELDCPNNFDLVSGITFNNCDMNALCPDAYTLNEEKLLCDQPIPCVGIDSNRMVCYESENGLCSSPTALVETSTNFPGYNLACADPAICKGAGGTGSYINGSWQCADNSTGILCSGKVDGWEELFCTSTQVKKWESNDGLYPGPICQPKTMFATDSSGNPRIPKQDYELSSSLSGKLPEYKLWIPNESSMTCDKATNVYRCPLDPTSTTGASFTEVINNGEYTGHRGTVGIYTNIACEAPIKYARNIWTETKGSGVQAASVTCVSTTNNTISNSHILYDYTKGTYQCKENTATPKYTCGGEYGSGIQDTTSSTLAQTYTQAGSPKCPTITTSTYYYAEKVGGVVQVKNSSGTIQSNNYGLTNVVGKIKFNKDYVYSLDVNGTTITPALTKTCSSLTNNTKTSEQYYDYTAGTFKCTNNATMSYGSGTGSLGNMSGAQSPTYCTGTYGSTTQNTTNSTLVNTYNSSTMTCPLYDQGKFTWTETCPSGYVFNTEPNGAVTAIPSGDRLYNQRYNSSASNYNNERCYMVNSAADITYFDRDKYLIREFPVVTEYWSDIGYKICDDLGLSWDDTVNKCVGPKDECFGVFNTTDGKCETLLTDATCSAGYSYVQSTQRCEKDYECPLNGSANGFDLTCELNFQDSCADQHISGFNRVCASNVVCGDDGTSVLIDGEYMCKSTKNLICPNGYQPDPSDSTKCVAPAHCPVGYIEKNGQCELTYNWSTYDCEDDFIGPMDPGLNCNGSCGYDGCWCNGMNSPANNCKKEFSLLNGAETFDLWEKRRLQHFFVYEGALAANEFGEFKNSSCGDNCLDNVNYIYGKNNQLCFEKGNKESYCFVVNDCYFNGEISFKNIGCQGDFPVEWIKNMYIDLLGRCPEQAGYDMWVQFTNALGITNRDGLRDTFCTAASSNGEYCIYNTTIPEDPTQEVKKGEINNLFLFDSHTLMTDSSNMSASVNAGLSGNVRIVSTPNKGFDYGEYTTNPTFTSWDPGLRSEGFSLSKSAIKLSNGKWYVKATANGTRGCGYNSTDFLSLPDANFNIATYSSNCYDFTATTPLVNDCATDLTITIPSGLAIVEYSDIESVATNIFNVDGCTDNNAYDEQLTLTSSSIPNPITITRQGVGAQGSGGMNLIEASCMGTYDPALNICINNDFSNAIVSTCKMNGHVGWTGRSEGIVAINTGSAITRFSVIEANGTATFNQDWTNLDDLEGKTEWNGFNIGTMALQLSDGNWYVSKSFKNNATNTEVTRRLPDFVKRLDNSNYVYDINSTIGLDCFYQGQETNTSCSSSLKIIMPDPKLSLVGISDIESLYQSPDPLYIVGDNNFNLQLSVGDYNATYQGTGVVPVLSFETLSADSNITEQEGQSSTEHIMDRLQFWDSYKDKDIGFIEFVRDVHDKDRLDNFVPESQVPYEMAKLGFTSIDYSQENKTAYFVKPTPTNSTECQAAANYVGGDILTTWPEHLNSTISSIGTTRPGACTILKDTKEVFNLLAWAVRKNTYTGNFEYMCSPYICNLEGICDIATCPVDTLDSGTEIEYFGNILPASFYEPGCRAQSCDALKDYVNYCGRKIGCNEDAPNTIYENNACYEMYCTEGNLDSTNRTCQVEGCPVGSIEASDGSCRIP